MLSWTQPGVDALISGPCFPASAPPQAQDGDLDALERVLDAVAHGDLQGADPSDATPEAVAHLFGASQLAVQYLLYVQDRLAADNSAAKVRPGGAPLLPPSTSECLRSRMFGVQARVCDALHQSFLACSVHPV
jgi:hypothetical protein